MMASSCARSICDLFDKLLECWIVSMAFSTSAMGPWLCENALTEALRRRHFGKVAMQGHFSEISGFLSGRAPDADSGHLGRLCNWRRKHVFDDYALIPARSGWTSMMFMTRVRL